MSRILQPFPLILIMVGISALAWLVPGESPELRGFGDRADFSWQATLTLALFYAVIVGVILLGTFLGRRIPTAPWLDGVVTGIRRGDAFDARVYYVLTALSVVGVGYLIIATGGPLAFIDAMIHTNANELKAATGGQPGLATLRYTAAVAAPIGLHRLLLRRRGYVSAALNILLLLTTAFVASRLSLMMATVIFLFLIVRRPVVVRAKFTAIALGAVLIGAALVFLNYVRNAGYYERFGVHDPVSAAFFQALTYLGAPFQVSLGMAGALVDDPAAVANHPFPAFAVLVPSFFTDVIADAPAGAARYHDLVDVHFTLSTNSAFADTLIDYGILGLVLSVLWVLLYAALFGWLARISTYVSAAAGVALYCFAEYWRLLLMNQGVAIYAVTVPLIAGLLAAISFKIGSVDRVLTRLEERSRGASDAEELSRARSGA